MEWNAEHLLKFERKRLWHILYITVRLPVIQDLIHDNTITYTKRGNQR